jgi:nitrite reductase/ring-hydroxylating ferredoxin subunit
MIGGMPRPSPVRYQAAKSADVAEHGRLVVDIGERTIGVFRVGGRLYAYENTCPHQGGPVCQGLVIPAVRERLDEQNRSTGYVFDESDLRIVCPWHGYEFSITTGAHPARASIRLTPVAVEEEDGVVYVSF